VTIPYYRQSQCDFCGTCVGVCPENAIELAETTLVILEDLCTACMNCVIICPTAALEERDDRKEL
jgi:MinD superfamily P-loop ATPase